MKENGKIHYGFYVAVGMFFMYFLNGFVSGIATQFIMPVCEELGASRAQWGMGNTIMMVAIAILMKPLIAPLFNKLDTRVSLTIVTVGMAAALALRAMATSIVYFWVASVILIIPFSILMNLMLSILSANWFAKKQGTIMSFVSLGQGLSGMILNAIGGYIIQNMGWRACYWIWAAGTLAIGLPMSLFIIRKKPEDKGLLPYGYGESANAAGESASEKQVVKGMSASKATKTAAFWMIGIGLGLLVFATGASQYINSYTQTLGYTAVMAGYISSAISAGNLVGKASLGTLADKIGAYASGMLSIILGLLSLIGVALFAQSAPFALIYIFTFFAGLMGSAANLVFPLLTREVFGSREYAKIWPSVVVFLSLIGAFGSTIMGMLVDALGSYPAVMMVGAGVLAVVVILILMASGQRKKIQEQWTEE